MGVRQAVFFFLELECHIAWTVLELGMELRMTLHFRSPPSITNYLQACATKLVYVVLGTEHRASPS